MTADLPAPVPGGRMPATPLTQDRIIEACTRIADTEGAAAVTMRRLGRELGVDATAVYRHFRDKDEILRAAADRLLSTTLDGLAFTGDWRFNLRHLAEHVRRVYMAHPGVAVLVSAASEPLPSEARATETALAILRSAGLRVEDAVAAFEVLQDYILAVTGLDAARAEAAARGGPASAAWRRQFAALPREAYPNVVAAAELLYRDDDARFILGMDLLIEAIDARLATQRERV